MFRSSLKLILALVLGVVLVGCSAGRQVSSRLQGTWYEYDNAGAWTFSGSNDLAFPSSNGSAMAKFKVPEDNVLEVQIGGAAIRYGIREIGASRAILSAADGSDIQLLRDKRQTLPALLQARASEILKSYKAALSRFPKMELLPGAVDVSGSKIDFSHDTYWGGFTGSGTAHYNWQAADTWKSQPGWESSKIALDVPLANLDDPVPPARASGSFAPDGGIQSLTLQYHPEWKRFAAGQFFGDEKAAQQTQTSLGYTQSSAAMIGKWWLSLGDGYALMAVWSGPSSGGLETPKERSWVPATQ